MEAKDYTLTKIEGEYAYLADTENGAEVFIVKKRSLLSFVAVFIALALLPAGVDVGTRLHFEMLEYTVIE